MKIGQLKSLGHNIADSLASGIGLMIGVYDTDVFAEASSNESCYLSVNFINGEIGGGPVSDSLRGAALRYSEALPELCAKHKLNVGEIRILEARYGTDQVYGRHFTVTVEATDGRRSVNRYIGVPGRLAKAP